MTEDDWVGPGGFTWHWSKLGTVLPPSFGRRQAHRAVAAGLPHVLHLLPDGRQRAAAAFLARCAVGGNDPAEHAEHRLAVRAVRNDGLASAAGAANEGLFQALAAQPVEVVFALAWFTDALAREPAGDRTWDEADVVAFQDRYEEASRPFTAVLREVVGNPFRPVLFAPGWRTEAVVALARQVDAGGGFALLPVLADALEDAGCDAADLLAHCRDRQAAHAPGCWAVDLVLGPG